MHHDTFQLYDDVELGQTDLFKGSIGRTVKIYNYNIITVHLDMYVEP